MRFEWDKNTNWQTFASTMFALKLPFSFSTIRTLLRNATTPLTMKNAGYWLFIRFMKSTTKKSFASSQLVPRSPRKGEPMRKLTKEQKRDIQAIAAKRDEDIDFSDAPAVLDWSAAEVGKFYRPTKKPVTMRLDSDVIAWLKADGRGYQTKANWLLRHAMLSFTGEKSLSKNEGVERRRKTRPQSRKSSL
jgi:uncharacterized protein (DUF4415 family)